MIWGYHHFRKRPCIVNHNFTNKSFSLATLPLNLPAAEAESHPFKSMFAAASEVPEADLAVGGRGLKYVGDRAIKTYTPSLTWFT